MIRQLLLSNTMFSINQPCLWLLILLPSFAFAHADVSIAADTAQPADWRLGGKSDTRTEYINFSNIAVKGQLRQYWVKILYKEDQPAPGFKPYREMLMREEANCFEHKTRILSVLAYDSSGNVAMKGRAHDTFSPIKPGSETEVTFNLACSHK
jgi:hypothetical protein